MKVKLEDGVWLTEGDGDPSRTLVEASATEYSTMVEATHALADARKFRSFKNAEIVEDVF